MPVARWPAATSECPTPRGRSRDVFGQCRQRDSIADAVKTLFQIVKAFRAELLAVLAILVQQFAWDRTSGSVVGDGGARSFGQQSGNFDHDYCRRNRVAEQKGVPFGVRAVFLEEECLPPRDIYAGSNAGRPPLHGYGLPAVRPTRGAMCGRVQGPAQIHELGAA